jgi:sRNA-binding regulator protein Hfq
MLDYGPGECGGNLAQVSELERGTRGSDDGAFNGTRKLVRPHLPAGERRRDLLHGEDPLSHAALAEPRGVQESSHAEAFYFQKQVQQHTEMTVVLEDGEELHGVIEWYDKCVIKLRSGRRRVMIYKSGVKYMFKSSERALEHPVMK